MFKVQDASRILQFDGVELARSSSARPGSLRWAEFTLYRTKGGSYIVALVGQTIVYHASDCRAVTKSGLPEIPIEALSTTQRPCPDCRPDRRSLRVVHPEAIRHRATVCDSPEGIIETLYRRDDNRVRYLTDVAAELLDRAADNDPQIAAVYRTETIA